MKLLTVVLFALILVACATGSSIVTGDRRSPISTTQVRIYLKPPQNYEVVGIVKARSLDGLTDQQKQDFALAELKRQAAMLGANGILLKTVGDETQQGALFMPTASGGIFLPLVDRQAILSGLAIYVK